LTPLISKLAIFNQIIAIHIHEKALKLSNNMKLFFTLLLLSVNLTITYSQISPYEICLDEGSAFIGLDRKNWTSDLSQLSESYQLDFQVPDPNPDDCIRISSIDFNVVDFSGSDSTPPGCFLSNFTNLVLCNDHGPASCDFIREGAGVQNFSLNNFQDEFLPGELFGFDIVAVIDANNPACSQTAISDGDYSASLEVCMTVNYEQSGPIVDLGGDLDICADGTVEIEGPEDYNSYEWDGPVESFEPIHPNATVGRYILTVTDDEGCTGTDDIEVFPLDPFTVEITNNDPLVICDANTEVDVLINGMDDTNGYMFTWTYPDGSTTSEFTIIPDIPGTYNLAVFDIFSTCTVEDSILVDFTQLSPAQIDSISMDVVSICDGVTLNLEAFIPFTDLGNYTFQWVNGMNVTTSQNYPVTTPGQYILNLLNDQNCPITSDTITVNLSPLLSAGDDITLATCSEELMTLNSLIAGNADPDGQWTDLDNSGGLSMTEYNTTGLIGTYRLQYVVSNPPPCDNDTAVITLIVNEAYSLTNDDELCDSDFVIVNSVRYDSTNPTGTERMTTIAGCDSIVTIDLTFINGFNTTEDDELCETDFITVNNVRYDINNPTGTEMLTSVNGCDSTVTIDLTFMSGFNTTEDDELCETDFITANNVRYDINNPTGTEMLTSVNGCDSTVTIDLTFISGFNTTEDDELCETDFITVNNVRYDINNPTGTEMLTSVNGCDSTVTIDLTFISEFNTTEDDELCETDFIIVNNVRYDITNPTGTEMLTSVNGCDSTVTIDLTFISEFNTTEDDELCETDFIIVNNVRYDITNPTGTEMLTSVNGCDSTVTIDLFFIIVDNGMETLTPCVGEMIPINNQDISISGMYLDTIQALNGCDSIVEYNVLFQDCDLQIEIENVIDVTCFGDTDGSFSFDINGDPGFPLNYEISPNIGTNATGIAADNDAITITDLPPGNYTLTVSNMTASQTASILIEEPEEIIVEITIGNDILCSGDMDGALEASVTSGNSGNLSFSWNTMATTQTIENLSTGIYSVIVSDDNLCSDEASITLSEPDAIEFSVTPTNISCGEVPTGELQIDMITGGTAPYGASIDNSDILFSDNFDSLAAGSYTVTIIDDNGCMAEREVTISEESEIVITPIGPYDIQQGESVLLDLALDFIPTTIEWKPNATLDCTDCLTPTAQPLVTSTYTVTVTDDMGCTASTEVIVNVTEIVIPDPEIYIPNIFNPSDIGGQNGTFAPLSSDDVALVIDDLIIYDRWGNVVYQDSGDVTGWNGTRNDTDAEVGVYLYRIEYQSDGRSEVRIGEVTLVR